MGILKVFSFASPFLVVAFIVAMLSGGRADFSREIPQPVEVVAAALADLDIMRVPHVQARMRSSGTREIPRILVQRTEAGLQWLVMSGEETALTMTAALEPTADGRGTHVAARVEEGSLSNPGSVPRIFRTASEMEDLFSVAVERELADFIPRGERSLRSLQERPYG